MASLGELIYSMHFWSRPRCGYTLLSSPRGPATSFQGCLSFSWVLIGGSLGYEEAGVRAEPRRTV
ncbi:maltose permease MAL61 [Alternaria alternata]|nr:maltose permease MAL61 [Alternaria alternata]